jgi:hypothetical protein
MRMAEVVIENEVVDEERVDAWIRRKWICFGFACEELSWAGKKFKCFDEVMGRSDGRM